MKSALSLGIDLGGTYARVALVTDGGRLEAAQKRALVDRSPSAVVATIGEAVDALFGQAAGAEVLSCGVGVAAQLRGETGVIAVAPNLGWREVPFGALLARRLARPVAVVNDLSAAAWGEHRVGAGVDVEELLVVFVGTGVGAALIVDGRLVSGATGLAGELGHVKVVPEGGLPCGCGQHGCLEAYVGGKNLLRLMRERVASGSAPLLAERVGDDDALLDPALLEEAALAGDEGARELYEQTVGHLGLAVANQVSVLNPARLILGGGVLSRAPGIVERVSEAVHRYASRTAAAEVEIVMASGGDDSGLVGAALLGRERLGTGG